MSPHIHSLGWWWPVELPSQELLSGWWLVRNGIGMMESAFGGLCGIQNMWDGCEINLGGNHTILCGENEYSAWDVEPSKVVTVVDL